MTMLDIWRRRVGALMGSTLSPAVKAALAAETDLEVVLQEMRRTQLSDFADGDVRDLPGASLPTGVSPKRLVEAGGRRYLLKQTGTETTLRSEAVSWLANRCGLPTPLVIEVRDGSVTYQAIPLATDATHFQGSLLPTSEDVLDCFLTTRWFNEAVWNTDCWHGNFIVRFDTRSRVSDLVMVDFDEALSLRTARWLQRTLREVFGLTVPIDECSWSEVMVRRHRGLTFDQDSFDSPYTAYGKFWRQYVEAADFQLPVAVTVGGIQQAACDIGCETVAGGFARYLDYCSGEFRGLVPLRAERRWISGDELVSFVHQRLQVTAASAESFFRNQADRDTLRRQLVMDARLPYKS